MDILHFALIAVIVLLGEIMILLNWKAKKSIASVKQVNYLLKGQKGSLLRRVRKTRRRFFKKALINIAKMCTNQLIVVTLFRDTQPFAVAERNQVVASKIYISLYGYKASVYVVDKQSINIKGARLERGKSRLIFVWYENTNPCLPKKLIGRGEKLPAGFCCVKM